MILDKITEKYNDLSDRDKRAVKFGSIMLIIVLVYGWIISPLVDDYESLKYKISQLEEKLSVVISDNSGTLSVKQKRILKAVPIVKAPVTQDKQKQLFRDAFYQQLRLCGVKITANPTYSSKAIKSGSSRYVLLKSGFQCDYQQLLKLLAEINTNPYLLSIEKIKIDSDSKKHKLKVAMTVSTLVK